MKNLTTKLEAVIITTITIISLNIAMNIYQTYMINTYRANYHNLTLQVAKTFEDIYTFHYNQTKSYDDISQSIVGIENKANFLYQSLLENRKNTLLSIHFHNDSAFTLTNKINDKMHAFSQAAETLLAAKVSLTYSNQTVISLKNQLLDKYPKTNDRLSILSATYEKIEQPVVSTALFNDQIFNNLISYISLRNRVTEDINKQTSSIALKDINTDLKDFNHILESESSEHKHNIITFSIVLFISLSLYVFWKQWYNYQHKLVTRQHLLDSEKERSKLAFIIESAQDAIFVTNRAGYITWVNKGFETLSGFSRTEAINQSSSLLLQKKEMDQEQLLLMQKCAQQRSAVQTEIINFHKLGHPYWIDVVITPIFDHDDTLTGYIAVERDITKRRELEDNLEKAVEKAQASNNAKSTFLATMSHELRTPLNGILGMAQIIDSSTENKTQKEQLSILIESGNHLLSLLNDILDFSKIEQNKMELELLPFKFDDILLPIKSTYDVLCHEKGIEFELQDLSSQALTYNGDKARIRQIIFNLLSNAVKFTTTGTVRLIFSDQPLADKKHKLTLIIKDSGIGIPEERLDDIFNPFTQAESSTTRVFGGTGLGLAIVKQFIDLMQGTIVVESEMGIGTTFTITFELSHTDTLHEETQLEQSLDQHVLVDSLSILLVEDNRVNTIVAKTFCTKQGHTVSCAENGQVAIDMLQKDHYDLIIMDNHMPVMDGIEATRVIREELKLSIVILGCTADVFKEAHDSFVQAGVDHVLTKPLQKASFIDALQKYQHRFVTNKTTNSSDAVIELHRSKLGQLPEHQFTESEVCFAHLLANHQGNRQQAYDKVEDIYKKTENYITQLIGAYTENSSEDITTTSQAIQNLARQMNAIKLLNKATEIALISDNGKVPDNETMQTLVNLLEVNSHQARRILDKRLTQESDNFSA
ncbi:hypothetical protein BCU68_03170 [Vibrio sp. 10N.286.49.B3]|uniref:ATP-binding protein n=1 Tax=Vibrio sp. 10N.286.49.B3 TaxID=1880855 RepID=UPI000C81D464|nr:ATP-binding protein [Vibrio sp. 10N.286.49.B3]PMH44515.1 hypothetical protein BCU68_03170 [Vibrio sp. 10N.286.49.B3]